MDNLADVSDAITNIITDATNKLLTAWHAETPGKSDDAILRDKLVECGWRYRRVTDGGWRHPERPDAVAPRTLSELARLLAAYLAEEAASGE